VDSVDDSDIEDPEDDTTSPTEPSGGGSNPGGSDPDNGSGSGEVEQIFIGNTCKFSGNFDESSLIFFKLNSFLAFLCDDFSHEHHLSSCDFLVLSHCFLPP